MKVNAIELRNQTDLRCTTFKLISKHKPIQLS